MAVNGPQITRQQCAQYAINAGFTGNDVGIAVAVATAESNLIPINNGRDSNGTTDWGLMMLNDGYSDTRPTELEKTDPQANMNHAYRIFKQSGWKAWSSYNSGSYRKFLPQQGNASDAWFFVPGGPLTGGLPIPVPSSPGDVQTPLGGAISGALSGLSGLQTTIANVFSNALAIGVGLTLLILGIVILVRNPLEAGAKAGAKIGALAAL